MVKGWRKYNFYQLSTLLRGQSEKQSLSVTETEDGIPAVGETKITGNRNLWILLALKPWTQEDHRKPKPVDLVGLKVLDTRRSQETLTGA